jgi:hypothetical protein
MRARTGQTKRCRQPSLWLVCVRAALICASSPARRRRNSALLEAPPVIDALTCSSFQSPAAMVSERDWVAIGERRDERGVRAGVTVEAEDEIAFRIEGDRLAVERQRARA